LAGKVFANKVLKKHSLRINKEGIGINPHRYIFALAISIEQVYDELTIFANKASMLDWHVRSSKNLDVPNVVSRWGNTGAQHQP